MVKVIKEGIVLRKSLLGFENSGVLNPAVIQVDGVIHMFYRAVKAGNYSSIGYCRLSSPTVVSERFEIPVLFPHFDYESHGVEDPRIVKIEDTYYMTYTAYNGINALGALATSKDLIHFEKQGILVPQYTFEEFSRLAEAKSEINQKYHRYNEEWKGNTQDTHRLVWDKNVIFFPRKINGKFCFLHRIKPDIQFVSIKDLDELTPLFWENYFFNLENKIVLTAKYKHEVSYIGGGCPPIETKEGWLLIYHSVYDTIDGYVYVACAALLDINNPQIEIGRLSYPLFEPERLWEQKGEVDNVCFPTGAIVKDDKLFIYYGAADERIACASLILSELISELTPKHQSI